MVNTTQNIVVLTPSNANSGKSVVSRLINNLIRIGEVTRTYNHSFEYEGMIFSNVEELKIYLTTCHG